MECLSDHRPTGVVLLNLGGPKDLAGIPGFLKNLLSDPAVVPAPWPIRPWLARRIARKRSPMVAEHYRAIGGKSPIGGQTRAQVEALAADLGEGFLVRSAFRHSEPGADRAVQELFACGVRKIIALPVYPQWSASTSGSALADLKRAARAHKMEVLSTPSFPTGKGYIQALWESCSPLIEKSRAQHVLVSAHGLPQRLIDKGDPYVKETEQTFAAFSACLPSATPCSLAYQSRLGPVAWTQPYLVDEIKRLADEGVSALVVVPISFACENLETRYELDLETAQWARECGIESFRRAPSPGIHPAFIEQLAQLVGTTNERQGHGG